jgi:hypothetical protein
LRKLFAAHVLTVHVEPVPDYFLDKKGEEDATFCSIKDGTFFPLPLSSDEPAKCRCKAHELSFKCYDF